MPSTTTSARRPARRPSDGSRRRPGSRVQPSGQRRQQGRTAQPPKAQRVSALEQALTDSAALPLPQDPTFADLGLSETLVAALRRRMITTPTAVQARTLPDALAGRDVLGRAQTGAGKTLAFGLPLVTRLAATAQGPARPRRPRALVLVPTRELAQQVTDAITPFAHTMKLRMTSIYGGTGMKRQIDALVRGVDIVVATPGRLEDHIRQGNVRLDGIQTTVLDEADYMADLGFVPAIHRLLALVPSGTQRLLFSATLDRGVEDLVHRYLQDPALHAVATATARIETMQHRAFSVRSEDKVAVTAQVAGRSGRTLLFVRTKHGADRLARQLSKAGVRASAIHGGLRQNQRTKALAEFTDGSGKVLVATDVAARGIHVDGVDLVVHYDPPADHKDYLHRSGRTARAGANGTVLSLLLPEQVRAGEALQRQLGTGAVVEPVVPGHPVLGRVTSEGTQLSATA